MTNEFDEIDATIKSSPLYSEDLAPVPVEKRTWTTMSLTAIWVGMAVCVPTYLMAAAMIKTGVSWYLSLIIIGLANLIITVPMVLNGHAGVKYGIPFPVIGRASFGYRGVHIASTVRAIVAAGWFGIQTWIGGLAFYAIWNAITGNAEVTELCYQKFICFFLFWMVNMYFVWKGAEGIKWLEQFSAPILILIGVLLIVWGTYRADGFFNALDAGKQLVNPSMVITHNRQNEELLFKLNPLRDNAGKIKAEEFQLTFSESEKEWKTDWKLLSEESISFYYPANELNGSATTILSGESPVRIQMRATVDGNPVVSGIVPAYLSLSETDTSIWSVIWPYILWLTAMVGFWATMSLSIADITRYAISQKAQVKGQFLGLPGTMILYSFVGIFVTSAAIVIFKDVLIPEDAPWDPVSLLSHFESPWLVVVSQIFMIIATLSTNLAANVIAPANAFANLFPKKISFKSGGYITGLIGILVMPWWLLNDMVAILVFISGLLGPVLGIMLVDYFIIRKKNLKLAELYKTNGKYSFFHGFNPAAIIALTAGIGCALIGFWIPQLDFLYKLSWFTGFIVSFVVYYWLMRKEVEMG